MLIHEACMTQAALFNKALNRFSPTQQWRLDKYLFHFSICIIYSLTSNIRCSVPAVWCDRGSLYFCNPAIRSPSLHSTQGIWLPLRDGFLMCVFHHKRRQAHARAFGEVGWMKGKKNAAFFVGEPWQAEASAQLAQWCCWRCPLWTDMGWTHAWLFGLWRLVHMDATLWKELQTSVNPGMSQMSGYSNDCHHFHWSVSISSLFHCFWARLASFLLLLSELLWLHRRLTDQTARQGWIRANVNQIKSESTGADNTYCCGANLWYKLVFLITSWFQTASLAFGPHIDVTQTSSL